MDNTLRRTLSHGGIKKLDQVGAGMSKIQENARVMLSEC